MIASKWSGMRGGSRELCAPFWCIREKAVRTGDRACPHAERRRNPRPGHLASGMPYPPERVSPGSGLEPDTLARFSAGGVVFDPVAYLDDSTAIAQDWNRSIVARFNPRDAAATMDTILTGARFPSVSPGGRLVVYQTAEGSRVMVTTFPTPSRRWQIASQGVEPLMLAPSTVLYRQGAAWYTVTVDPTTGEPSGAPVAWATDPRFSDTSGWSNVPTHDGGIIYVQAPEHTSPGHFRVVPGWVAQMKRAVDGARP
jgi:hypothetical protein